MMTESVIAIMVMGVIVTCGTLWIWRDERRFNKRFNRGKHPWH